MRSGQRKAVVVCQNRLRKRAAHPVIHGRPLTQAVLTSFIFAV